MGWMGGACTSSVGPPQRAVQLLAVEQIAQPLEPGEFFVHKILMLKADAFERFIKLLRASMCVPLEFEIRESPRELSKIGFVCALVRAGFRHDFELTARNGLHG